MSVFWILSSKLRVKRAIAAAVYPTSKVNFPKGWPAGLGRYPPPDILSK